MALIKGEGTHQILYGGVNIFSGLRHNRGYLARPDHAGSFPTVLLAHGENGITASVKSLARRLARYGLAVVGPDLYRSARSAWPPEARISADLGDTRRWMASSDTPWIRPGPAGLLALDRSATAALRLADDPDLIGGVILISPTFEDVVGETGSPLLGFYGKDDEVVSAEDRGLAQENLANGEWVLYGGVGHGLIDESAPDYRWDVAEDVADRSVEFFKRIL